MEQYNFRLKEYRKIALKFYLAPWRVLVIDKCAALTRAAAKHTPRNGNKNNAENQTERRGGAEPSPLNRLGIGCRFSAVRSLQKENGKLSIRNSVLVEMEGKD